MSLPGLSEILTIKTGGEPRLSFPIALRQPEHVLASFVMTKEAEGSFARVLFALRRGRPGAFWLSGPRGSGKTHFLACLTALFANRPTTVPEGFRDDLPDMPTVCVPIETADGARLAQAVSEALWEKLKVPQHLSALWRRLGTEVGLRATLEEVGRNGFKRTIVMIDDAGENGPDSERWRMLNDLAAATRSFKSPAFFIVATRGEPPEGIPELPVSAKGAREVVALTLSGIRGFAPNSDAPLKSYYDLYTAANATLLDFDEFQSIFPFHERTIEVLEALGRNSQREGVMAEIVRETLSTNGSEPPLLASHRLVMPADLLRSSAAKLRIRAASLEQSFETYELALMRLSQMELSPAEASLASDLVKTLFLASFATEQRRRNLKVSDLVQLTAFNLPSVDAPIISKMLASMAVVLDGMIVVETDGRARYQPTDRPDSFLRRWNDGLALLRLVEPELSEAHDVATLFAQAEKFRTALRNRGANLSQLSAELRNLAAILGASPPALTVLTTFGDLLDTDNHEAYLRQAAHVAGGAEELPALADEVARLQRLAAQAPKLSEIKRYLDAIPGSTSALEKIDSVRIELLVALDFQTMLARPELADSVAERFKQFKAQYRELYLAAHRQRRAEVEQFGNKLELQQLRFAVLTRLNRVRELGNRIGTELESDLKKLTMRLMPCPETLEPNLEASPRCSACEFGFQDGPPLAEIEALEIRLMAALGVKLEALARPSVARILAENDSQQRLGAMLELLRQGAKDELIPVLDDETATYIISLLNKVRSEAATLIVGRIFRDWPAVSEDDLDDVVHSFAAELRENLRKINQSHPERRGRLSLS
jgi:hypothetical protein